MQVQVHLNNQSNQSCQDLQMFFLLELHCTEYKTVLCLKRERRGNLNLSDLTQGWRLKSSIKPDSCLGRGGGGGAGKETKTFQTNPLITLWAHFPVHSACREGGVGGCGYG